MYNSNDRTQFTWNYNEGTGEQSKLVINVNCVHDDT